jgi:hypothetical protein
MVDPEKILALSLPPPPNYPYEECLPIKAAELKSAAQASVLPAPRWHEKLSWIARRCKKVGVIRNDQRLPFGGLHGQRRQCMDQSRVLYSSW